VGCIISVRRTGCAMMSKKAYVMIWTQNLSVTLWISNFMSATGHLGFCKVLIIIHPSNLHASSVMYKSMIHDSLSLSLHKGWSPQGFCMNVAINI
jgi:hypothetical protein